MFSSDVAHEHEEKLTAAVREYEELCNGNRAQSREARGLHKYIQNALSYRGMKYCTATLAKYGHRRYFEYVRRGAIDGYAVNESGRVVKIN